MHEITKPATLKPIALTASAFSEFGDVIELSGKVTPQSINNGMCDRYNDLSLPDADNSGRTGISLFNASHYSFPISLNQVERHPLGSQVFIPMSENPFLVIVATDNNGKPEPPLAFITNGRQAVNYRRNTWHGVLTPIGYSSLFAVIDYIGTERNLEEFIYAEEYQIQPPDR